MSEALNRRVIILMMDSFGVGASADAVRFGDEGADTFGNLARACAEGRGDREGLRSGPLQLPHLEALGLGLIAAGSTGRSVPGVALVDEPQAIVGYAVEQSCGKDTPSGHWEMAGVITDFDWGYFPQQPNCFPAALIEALKATGGIEGVLGGVHASGTEIITQYGEEHLKTGYPIVYTSADSVFQIAAHEESFGLERLYVLCERARTLVDEYRIGRVIARPFTGVPGAFVRTGNRRDYSIPPPAPTLLDVLKNHGREVISVGKVSDIFAHSGLTQCIKAHGNDALMAATLEAVRTAPPGSLVFTNLVDFDTLYGHRRDVPGYAHALEQFDAWLPTLRSILKEGDRVLITADHGCDPTTPGSDHTREHVPVLWWGPGLPGRWCGQRDTFADMGQTIAHHLGMPPLKAGVAFE